MMMMMTTMMKIMMTVMVTIDRYLSGDWGPGLADCSLSENNCDERIYNCSFFAECFLSENSCVGDEILNLMRLTTLLLGPFFIGMILTISGSREGLAKFYLSIE